MESSAAGELVLLMRTADPGLLPLVRTLLDAADIPHVVQGGEMMHLLPMGPLGGPGRLLQARIWVDPSRLEEARSLILEEAEVPAEAWPD